MVIHKLKSLVAQLITSIAVFAFAAQDAVHRTLTGNESRIFFDIYHWPQWLHPVFYVVTQAGSAGALLAVGFAFILRKMHRIALKVYINGALAYVMVTVAKEIIQRPRPAALLANITTHDYLAAGPGFPSGHTAVSTAMALTIWPLLPRGIRPVILLWPLLVGLSRVNLGVHAPLDIVGGFAVGWAAVTITKLFLRNILKNA
jgi:undecaprenyl-diphosphatase